MTKKDHDVPWSHIATKVIHAGQRPDEQTGAVMPTISLATTYAQDSPGVHKGMDYIRAHNPTRYALERMVARLEGSPITEAQDPSCGGFAFASGMAAMATALDLLEAGSRIVTMDDLYGGSTRLLKQVRERSQGLDVARVDMSNLEKFQSAMTPDTKMIWAETPTNPTMKVADLSGVAAIARRISPNCILVCDNTFATPVNQRPFEHDFDLVMHSTTKYLNGHSDSLGGILVARSMELTERIRFLQKSIGAVVGPFDAFLILRGIKTLDVRMARHNESGKEIARFLEGRPEVEQVVYPGLASHPSHEVCKKQMSGFTGMIGLELKGGLEEARRFLEAVEIFALAESLGGVESLIEHPAIMTHASIPPEMRAELGISDSLIRISVGLEDVRDLIADLEQALAATQMGARAQAANV